MVGSVPLHPPLGCTPPRYTPYPPRSASARTCTAVGGQRRSGVWGRHVAVHVAVLSGLLSTVRLMTNLTPPDSVLLHARYSQACQTKELRIIILILERCHGAPRGARRACTPRGRCALCQFVHNPCLITPSHPIPALSRSTLCGTVVSRVIAVTLTLALCV